MAWVERREHGALHTHELAADAAALLGRVDVAVSGAWDLIGHGLAEARLSAARRRRAVRVEVFATHRSAAHLLPATSLFSVLGDVPSRLADVDARWRAAPRLDLGGSAGVRVLDGDAAEDLTARATLRLDDRVDGAIGLDSAGRARTTAAGPARAASVGCRCTPAGPRRRRSSWRSPTTAATAARCGRGAWSR